MIKSSKQELMNERANKRAKSFTEFLNNSKKHYLGMNRKVKGGPTVVEDLKLENNKQFLFRKFLQGADQSIYEFIKWMKTSEIDFELVQIDVPTKDQTYQLNFEYTTKEDGRYTIELSTKPIGSSEFKFNGVRILNTDKVEFEDSNNFPQSVIEFIEKQKQLKKKKRGFWPALFGEELTKKDKSEFDALLNAKFDNDDPDKRHKEAMINDTTNEGINDIIPNDWLKKRAHSGDFKKDKDFMRVLNDFLYLSHSVDSKGNNFGDMKIFSIIMQNHLNHLKAEYKDVFPYALDIVGDFVTTFSDQLAWDNLLKYVGGNIIKQGQQYDNIAKELLELLGRKADEGLLDVYANRILGFFRSVAKNKDLLVEESDDRPKANLMIGRFQPFTKGHLKIAEQLKQQNGLRTVVAVIYSTKAREKEPQRYPYGQELMEEYMGKVVEENDEFLEAVKFFVDSNPYKAIEELSKKYAIKLFGTGTDRFQSYQSVKKYKDDYHLPQDFDVFEIKRSDDDVSGTQVRNALKNDEFEVYKDLMPSPLNLSYWFKKFQQILRSKL